MNNTTAATNNEYSFSNVGDIETVIAATSLIFLCIFGILSSSLIITVALKSKDPKLFYYIYLSVSICDLISALFSPFALYRITWGFNNWILSDEFCKIYWMFEHLVSVSKTLHLTAYIIYRLISMIFPFKFHTYGLKQIKVLTSIVWLISLIIATPISILWFGATARNQTHSLNTASCSVSNHQSNHVLKYAAIFYGIFLYFPILLMVIGWLVLLVLLYKRIQTRESKLGMKSHFIQKLLAIHLSAILGGFVSSYVFQSVYRLSVLYQHTVDSESNYQWWPMFISYLWLRIVECLNPIIFYKTTNHFFKEIDSFFLMMKKKKIPTKD